MFVAFCTFSTFILFLWCRRVLFATMITQYTEIASKVFFLRMNFGRYAGVNVNLFRFPICPSRSKYPGVLLISFFSCSWALTAVIFSSLLVLKAFQNFQLPLCLLVPTSYSKDPLSHFSSPLSLCRYAFRSQNACCVSGAPYKLKQICIDQIAAHSHTPQCAYLLV